MNEWRNAYDFISYCHPLHPPNILVAPNIFDKSMPVLWMFHQNLVHSYFRAMSEAFTLVSHISLYYF